MTSRAISDKSGTSASIMAENYFRQKYIQINYREDILMVKRSVY
jgi:hypothetical protein